MKMVQGIDYEPVDVVVRVHVFETGKIVESHYDIGEKATLDVVMRLVRQHLEKGNDVQVFHATGDDAT